MEDFLKRSLAFLLLIFFFPIFFIIYVLIKVTSKGPGFYQQWRTGKNKKPFKIIKFRTMVEDADKIKQKCKFLNKADGPVFKVYEDPRFTNIGKFLSHVGLDELPQLINILKGEMDFVGPRPFPIEEAEKIPQNIMKDFLYCRESLLYG
jgi:Sugar transferases involved in lipopolysaccharide synthesis